MGLPVADGTACLPCVLLPLGAGLGGELAMEGVAASPSEPPARAKGLRSVLLPSTPAAEMEAEAAAPAREDRCAAVPTLPRASLEKVGMQLEPLEELDRQLEKAVSNGDVPGLAYAILKDGKVVRANAFGVVDVENRRPWRFDTLCRIYSMTKSVAVCGFMRLVEDGLVALNDPISKFLPAFAQQRLQVVPDDGVVHAEPHHPAPRSDITVKHLLTHSSGVSQGAALGDDPSCATEEAYQSLIQRVDAGKIEDLEHWCEELAKLPLRFQPGERWEYSYSIDLLGRIIEVVSGKKLDEFLDEQVLTPLRMHDTTFALPSSKQDRLASFYRRREDNSLQCCDTAATSFWIESRQQRVLSAGGTVGSVAGGLVSTVDDFARLCCMLQNGGELDGVRLLREETVQTMFENMLPEMTGRADSWCLETAGLGFGILGSVAVPHGDANWYDVPGEVGWGGLAGTAWAVDRRDGLAVVSFTQVMYELWIDEEVRKAARKALGYSDQRPPASPQRAPAPAAEKAPESPSSEASTEASTPLPVGAAKRALEQPGAPSEETPKRPRLSAQAMHTQGSSEKLRLEKGEEGSSRLEDSELKEPNPFSLPLPELSLPVAVAESC